MIGAISLAVPTGMGKSPSQSQWDESRRGLINFRNASLKKCIEMSPRRVTTFKYSSGATCFQDWCIVERCAIQLGFRRILLRGNFRMRDGLLSVWRSLPGRASHRRFRDRALHALLYCVKTVVLENRFDTA